MHAAARDWVQRCLNELVDVPGIVVEFGSLDVNGSIRDLFRGTDYTGIDLLAGPGVDEVCDAAEYEHPVAVDLVLCCETLEHSPYAGKIVANAARLLRPGGWLILTTAGPRRLPHSADGGDKGPHEGEWYANISGYQLDDWLREAGFRRWQTDETYDDVRALAVR
jgi:SAM-dependent methyltransferase